MEVREEFGDAHVLWCGRHPGCFAKSEPSVSDKELTSINCGSDGKAESGQNRPGPGHHFVADSCGAQVGCAAGCRGVLEQRSHRPLHLQGLTDKFLARRPDGHDSRSMTSNRCDDVADAVSVPCHIEDCTGLFYVPGRDAEHLTGVMQAASEGDQYATKVVHGEVRSACLHHGDDPI